jgi:glutathione S-transferase
MPLLMMKTLSSACAVAAALKLMAQGWVDVAMMIRSQAGLLNPEDLRPGPGNGNRGPRSSTRSPMSSARDGSSATTSRASQPSSSPSTRRSHEVRATFYTVGSFVVMAMAFWVLFDALF